MAPSTLIQEAYAAASSRFEAANPKSKALHEAATKVLPGGNTRSVLFYAPFPLSTTSASASTLTSADENTYIDLLGEYTAGLYGHSDPVIASSIKSALSKGLSFGSHHANEARLANLVKTRFPSIELLRFTNSGTEATLMALGAARAVTGKKKVLVFANGYHGGAFAFAEGVEGAVNAPYEFLIAKYNSLESVQNLLSNGANSQDLAAIVVEPMMGSGGAIPANREFLEGLRKVADRVGAVLIYDEVMTSRMFSGGGVQSQLPANMRPDLTTLGKYIGGGMSFGAFGGKRSIMQLFDPRRPDSIKHAGTFNNNVLTMAAGSTGLEQIFTPERARQLHETGERLRKRLQEIGRGTLLKVTGLGSIMCFHFTATPIENIKSHDDIADSSSTLAGLLHLFLLERGFYIARRGFIALSLPLAKADLEGFATAVEEFVRVHRQLLVEPKPSARL